MKEGNRKGGDRERGMEGEREGGGGQRLCIWGFSVLRDGNKEQGRASG